MVAPYPSFSIVITTYNRWDLLQRAIASALAQTLPCEVIVVDDASSDGTGAALGQWLADLQQQGDLRLRYHRNATNQGHSQSVNTGVALAQGEWIKFLDDDDYLAPTCIEVLSRAIADRPSAVIVSLVAAQVTREGQELSRTTHPGPSPRFFIPQPDLYYGMLMEQVPFGTPVQVAMQRAAFLQTGGWKSILDTNFDDIDSWLSVTEFGDAIFLADCLAYRTVWPGGLNQKFSYQTRLQTHIAIKERIYAKVSDRYRPYVPPFPVIRAYLHLHWAMVALKARKVLAACQLMAPAVFSVSAWTLLVQIRLRRRSQGQGLQSASLADAPRPFWIRKVRF